MGLCWHVTPKMTSACVRTLAVLPACVFHKCSSASPKRDARYILVTLHLDFINCLDFLPRAPPPHQLRGNRVVGAHLLHLLTNPQHFGPPTRGYRVVGGPKCYGFAERCNKCAPTTRLPRSWCTFVASLVGWGGVGWGGVGWGG
jgi:hypothetical protein